MQFEISELHQSQLELLGLTQKDISSLPPRTLNALLSGNRTSLMRFDKVNIPGLSSPLVLDAKISLERKPDDSVSIKLHPINQSAKSAFNLNNDEIGHLASGETNFVAKQIKNKDGKPVDYLVTLDKTTNEFVAVKRDSILAPEAINGNALSTEQKNDFKKGKNIAVGNDNYRLDPNTELGIKEINNNPIKSISLKHSVYSQNELLIDLALLTSGLGHFVMLEHLADLALHNMADIIKHSKSDPLHNKATREAFAAASPEIIENFKQTQKLSPAEIKSLVEHHLGRPIELNKVDRVNISDPLNTEISVEQRSEAKVIDAETPKLSSSDTAEQREEKKDIADERKEGPQNTIQVKI